MGSNHIRATDPRALLGFYAVTVLLRTPCCEATQASRADCADTLVFRKVT